MFKKFWDIFLNYWHFDDFENQIFGEDIPKCDFEGGNQTINTNMYDEVWNSVEQETEELSQDNVPRIGVLTGIVTGETFVEKDPTLNWLFDVKDGSVIKHIKMTHIFSSKSSFLYYEFKRLQETLSAFGVDKSKIVEKSAENIANVCQYLVGTKIKIMQTRDNGYLRYKILETERR